MQDTAPVEKVQYPAVFVGSRYARQLDPPVSVFKDSIVMANDADFEHRYNALAALQTAIAGRIPPYTYQLVNVHEADALVARTRAELEAKANWNRASDDGEAAPEPEPEPPPPDPDPDPIYLQRAMALGRKAFAGQPAQLRRLERALGIVERGGVVERHDGPGWRVPADGWYGYWIVDGRTCTCPDHNLNHARYCKHTLAVALVRRARELKEGVRLEREPVPQPMPDPAWLREQDRQWHDYLDDRDVHFAAARGVL